MQMLGELQDLYREKSEWTDKLKKAMSDGPPESS
jgi:hypothetical protein